MSLALKPKPTLPGAADAVAAIRTAAASTAGTNPRSSSLPSLLACQVTGDGAEYPISCQMNQGERPKVRAASQVLQQHECVPSRGAAKDRGSPRCERASAAPKIATTKTAWAVRGSLERRRAQM